MIVPPCLQKKIFLAVNAVSLGILALCMGFTAAIQPLYAGSGHDPLTTPAEKAAIEAALGARLFDVKDTGKRIVTAGERGHILYSKDKGATWAQAEVPVSVTLTALSFPTPDTGWAVGHDGVILKTTDGGSTWALQLSGDRVNELLKAHIQGLIATKKDTGQGLDIEDLEYFLRDADTTLDKSPARHFMDVWFKNETRGLAVGAYGLIFETDDGGATWQSVFDRLDNIDGFHYYGIARAGGALFMAGEAGMLFRSDDEGQTWTRLESPYFGSFFGIMANPDGSTVIAYGMEGRAYESLDLGETWTHINIDNQCSYSAGTVLSDGSIILSGTSGSVFFSPGSSRPFEKLDTQNPETTAMVRLESGKLLLTSLNGLFTATTSK